MKNPLSKISEFMDEKMLYTFITFPSHNSKGFQRKDSVVKATHFFFSFLALVQYVENQNL